MLALDTVLRIARETPQSECKDGSVALFIRIDDTWGLKYYRDKETRDHTYKLQKKAHRFGAAPRIGRKFCFIVDSHKHYGYVTECIQELVAERMGPIGYYSAHIKLDDDYDYLSLLIRLEDAGITATDMHWRNVGYMNDGRMVAIDFDCEVMSI